MRIGKETMPLQVGKIIRRLRVEKKMTQADLSFEAEINTSYYSALENGANQVSLHKFVSICHALNESPDSVMAMILRERERWDPDPARSFPCDLPGAANSHRQIKSPPPIGRRPLPHT